MLDVYQVVKYHEGDAVYTVSLLMGLDWYEGAYRKKGFHDKGN